jgi:hypothetical protein
VLTIDRLTLRLPADHAGRAAMFARTVAAALGREPPHGAVRVRVVVRGAVGDAELARRIAVAVRAAAGGHGAGQGGQP